MMSKRLIFGLFMIGCGGPMEEDLAWDEDSTLCAECNGVDDLPDTFAPAQTVGVGQSFADEINTLGDLDHLKFYQQAGVLTRLQVYGADCWLHYKSSAGTYPSASYTDANTDPGVCYIQFQPTVSRWWYVRVGRTDKAFGMLASTGVSGPGPAD